MGQPHPVPSSMTTLYVTPERVYLLALPPALLFSTSDDIPTPLLSGIISDVTKTAGAGTASLDFTGNPCGTFTVVAECMTGGVINQLGVTNPGALPSFRLSVDAGITWNKTRSVSSDDDRAYIDYVQGLVGPSQGAPIGLRLVAQTGTYVAGDKFTATTLPSPDLVALIPPQCDYADGFAVGSWGDTLPLTEWGEDLEQAVADHVRWRMICKAGLQSREDMAKYHPDAVGATRFYQRLQSGEFAGHPAYKPSLKRGTGTSRTSFPLLVPAKDPLAGMLI